MIEYRQMKPDDINAGLKLCREANWNQIERDWQLFLQLSPKGCCVAVNEGKIVGTVTTISYKHSFSWTGMVLVDAQNQRQGIGMQLLQEALHILRNEETVKLDATPVGREVYLKLGFVDEYPLSRMYTIVDQKKLGFSAARAIQKNDLFVIAAFDLEIFGADRYALLLRIWESAPEYAFMVEKKSGVQGFCFGRQGYNYIHIGPVIANDIAVAKGLVSAALHQSRGRAVIIDVLRFDAGWLAWLLYMGFTEQRSFVRMYLGTNLFHAILKKQFAILGPEFG